VISVLALSSSTSSRVSLLRAAAARLQASVKAVAARAIA
jgi:hypothetical protein